MKRLLLTMLLVIVVISSVFTGGTTERSDVFPSKEITLIIPYGAGGANDRAARKMAEIAQKHKLIDKPMIVTNISGAATRAGITAVAEANPDGYTLLVHHNAMITASALGQLPKELSWNNAFKPIAQILETPLTFAVLNDSRWRTMKDLFDEIIANPGTIKFGFPGINAPQAFAFQTTLKAMRDEGIPVEVHPVYFEGGNAVKTAHFSKVVDVVPGITMDTVPEVESGMYRILSVVSNDRLKALPEVPTIEESGYPISKNSDGALRMIVWAPKNTPDDILNQLEDLLRKICETQDWKDFLAQNAAVEIFRNAQEVEMVFAADELAAIEVLPSFKL